jgi:ketosteroid isomerase-like protein
MSQEHVEVVRRVWEIAQRESDIGAAFDQCVHEGLVVPNVEWRGGARAGRAVAGVENAVGRDEYVETMRRLSEGFEDVGVELEQLLDAGKDRVVAITRHHATGGRSGVPVEMRTATVYWLEASRIVRMDPYLDPDDALKAVGLSDRHRKGARTLSPVLPGLFDCSQLLFSTVEVVEGTR